MPEDSNESRPAAGSLYPVCIALGTGPEAGLGAAFGNLAATAGAGVGLGVGFGVVFGGARNRPKKN
jgi:hypothetical protein